MNHTAFPTIAIPYVEPSVDDSGLACSAPSTSSYRPASLSMLTRGHRGAPLSKLQPMPDPMFAKPKLGGDTESHLDAAVGRLVKIILDRFPLAASTILLFVGSENNPHVDSTCARIATQLARRNIGDILLIDSNVAGNLSDFEGLGKSPGLSNLVNHSIDWRSLVTTGDSANLDFLPSGAGCWSHWGGVERLRQAAAEMKSNYQFVCVSAGDAHADAAHAWTGICDGSYLLVSLKNSNGTIAESAVTELRTSGARLLGCIVTDADL